MLYQVQETEKFITDLLEAASWLYIHNLEQSEEFADRKFVELENEIDGLKQHLKQTPRMGKVDEVSGLNQFPIYGGRFSALWLIDDAVRTVILLTLVDSKYPQSLRNFHFEE